MKEQFREQRNQVDEAEAMELAKKQFATVERILDSISDVRWLAQSDITSVVWESLNWLRGRGWIVYAGVLMPNHVHLLIRNEDGRTAEMLGDVARFKNYTAREANKVLGRSGAFWAREDFDHWIRNREKFEGTVRYIANNPVKAGMVSNWSEWDWTVIDGSVRYCLE
ncbi:transposase [Pontiella desulfatans]|uniref:transposase n=1 Tax=Pontiella desulfatans TaxID=2750659 RepID=UPI001444489B|nr:transposase [Pontiella desulfatans]